MIRTLKKKNVLAAVVEMILYAVLKGIAVASADVAPVSVEVV